MVCLLGLRIGLLSGLSLFFACSPADTLQAPQSPSIVKDTKQVQRVQLDADSVSVSLKPPPNESVDASVKPVTKSTIKSTSTPKHLSVYEIPHKRPSQEQSCKEKAHFSEAVYQKALSVAQKKPCQQNSDCILIRNTTNCVMKSSCNLESYEGVYKTHAKRLIGLRARLYNEVCPGCKKWAEKCRKPPMTARCIQRSCEVVSEHSSIALRLSIGKVQPANAEIQKTFSRRAKRFERCAKEAVMTDLFQGGTFQYEFTLNDKGEVTTFNTLQGANHKKVNECLMKIIKPYGYPPPQLGQTQFKQTLQFVR